MTHDTYIWLLENADLPIRYRVLRELNGDDDAAGIIECDLLEHPEVSRWLKNLKQDAIGHPRERYHGFMDGQFENAVQKCVQLGVHAGLSVMRDAAGFYLEALVQNAANRQKRNGDSAFYSIMSSNLLALAGFDDWTVKNYMLGSLDELSDFTCRESYDIYINDTERDKLPGVPSIWKQQNFIRQELIAEHGFCFPLIYDIIGLHKLYKLSDKTVTAKLDGVIRYIADDRYHHNIRDGYGILIAGKRRYLSMGWDAKFPGWDGASAYLGGSYASFLLYFALHISNYPPAVQTSWFQDVCRQLDTFRTESGTYLFPATWLIEKTGYAVGGQHMSFGENRHKKNWREIESTFYMALLEKNISSKIPL